MPLVGAVLGHGGSVQVGRLLGRPGSSEKDSSQDPPDVHVGECDRLAEGEARDGARCVCADPGERVERGNVARQPVGALLRDQMQGAGSPVVAEAGPLAEDGGQRRGREGLQGGEPAHEAFERGRDARRLGLLQHHLRDKDGVRISRVPPGEIPRGGPVMGQKGRADRV